MWFVLVNALRTEEFCLYPVCYVVALIVVMRYLLIVRMIFLTH